MIFFLFFLFLFSPVYGRVYDYPFDVTTKQLFHIETDNFCIIFSESSRSNAYQILQFAEEEFLQLTNFYGEFKLPQYIKNQKIRVVISTDFQVSNGFASLFIFPTIHLYTRVPPFSYDSHSYTGPSYLRTLFRHELTHIITLAVREYFPDSRFINGFNYAYVPSAIFSTRSFLESSAIARESDSGQGRLNDPYTYHLIRRTLLDNKLPSFAQFSGANNKYDTGHFPYTYGALFHKYLETKFSSSYELDFWKYVGQWKLTSDALKRVTKTSQKVFKKEFKEFLTPNETYETNINKTLSSSSRRINSIQERNNKIYYFNKKNRSLYAYDIKKKKNSLVVFGTRYWNKVSVSFDEKFLLVSGTDNNNKSFTAILHNKTLLPIKIYSGYEDAIFLPDTKSTNFVFAAINRTSLYPELNIISNNNITTVYKGSEKIIFDSPTAIDNKDIYLLQTHNSKRSIIKINRSTQKITILTNNFINHPRFLSGDLGVLSFSYTDSDKGFYKRAFLKDNQLILITNNIKGEMFESILNKNNTVYYRSSFANTDNIMFYDNINELTIKNQKAIFSPMISKSDSSISNFIPTIENKYSVFKDFVPMYGTFSGSLDKFGYGTYVMDSVGANFIELFGFIEFQRGTPEIIFAWENTATPLKISTFFENKFMNSHSVLQIQAHHLLNLGLSVSYQHLCKFTGVEMNFQSRLSWQGRLVGNIAEFPYMWSDLAIQQLIGVLALSWRYRVSEGSFGFERLFHVQFQYRTDFLHLSWQRIESLLQFSFPILPITFTMYMGYDTSSFAISGTSALGNFLMPSHQEYKNLPKFSKLGVFGEINALLYSWEIAQGLGFGEIFFHRLAMFSGYRIAYWDKPFQSVFLRTRFDMGLMYNNIPISFIQETIYIISTQEWIFDIKLNIQLPL